MHNTAYIGRAPKAQVELGMYLHACQLCAFNTAPNCLCGRLTCPILKHASSVSVIHYTLCLF